MRELLMVWQRDHQVTKELDNSGGRKLENPIDEKVF